MRRAIALWLGVFLLLLGVPGVGQAQSSIQIRGTIQAVDCKTQTVVLNGPGTSNTITVAPYTAVLANSMSVAFCSLRQYIGASASAWLVASGSEFVATRIDVSVAAAPAPVVPVAPAPAYYPYYGYYRYFYPYYVAYPYCYPYSVYYPYCYPYAGPFVGIGIVIAPGFRGGWGRR